MYTLTWIYFNGGTSHIGSVSSPSASYIWSLYWAMFTVGYRVRIWDRSRSLMA